MKIKNIFTATGFILSMILMFSACKKFTTTENIVIQKPRVGTAAYYENLKAYKSSDHSIAFGWFGGWTAEGASKSSYLTDLPDSVDLISIWGGWNNLTPEKQQDLKEVQTKKGTKVMICFILAGFGSGNSGGVKNLLQKGEKYVTATDTVVSAFNTMSELASLTETADTTIAQRHARALVDSVKKYGYDGFDIDWEPNIGGYYAEYTKNRFLFTTFVKEIGKYMGPQSNSGKLLCIDGEIDVNTATIGKYFDYFIAQAYGDGSSSNLQGRFNEIKSFENVTSKKFIVTSNFESYWQTGGPRNFTLISGSSVTYPQLLGYSLWNPIEGRKGGMGTFHMEYEFPNPVRDYHYLRTAIQLQNPAPY